MSELALELHSDVDFTFSFANRNLINSESQISQPVNQILNQAHLEQANQIQFHFEYEQEIAQRPEVLQLQAFYQIAQPIVRQEFIQELDQDEGIVSIDGISQESLDEYVQQDINLVEQLDDQSEDQSVLQVLQTKSRWIILFFKVIALYFLLLIGLSISAYAFIWREYKFISLFVLGSVFSNLLHFGSTILKVIPFFKRIIKESVNNPNALIIQHFLISPHEIHVFSILATFYNEERSTVLVNQSVFLIFYMVGWAQVENIVIPIWFEVPSLFLGTLGGVILLGGASILCIVLPIVICYTGLGNVNVRTQAQAQQPSTQKQLVFKNYKGNFGIQPCNICLQDYQAEDKITQLSCNANHIYHTDCISVWIQSHNNCPVCRAELK